MEIRTCPDDHVQNETFYMEIKVTQNIILSHNNLHRFKEVPQPVLQSKGALLKKKMWEWPLSLLSFVVFRAWKIKTMDYFIAEKIENLFASMI